MAPLAYFALTREGVINDMNFFGSRMIGKTYAHLKGTRFGLYVADQSRLIFNQFLDKVFTLKGTEICIVTMTLSNNMIKNVLLTGNVRKKNEQCLIAAIDITECLLLHKKSNDLEQLHNYFVD